MIIKNKKSGAETHGELVAILKAGEVPSKRDIIKYYYGGDGVEACRSALFNLQCSAPRYDTFVLRNENGNYQIVPLHPYYWVITDNNVYMSKESQDNETHEKRLNKDLQRQEYDKATATLREFEMVLSEFKFKGITEHDDYIVRLLKDRIESLEEKKHEEEVIKYAEQDSKVTAELYETVHKNEVEEIVANYLKENLKIELKKHGVSEKWLEVFLRIGGVVKGSGVKL